MVIILWKYKKLNLGISLLCYGNGSLKLKTFLLILKMALLINLNLAYNKEKLILLISLKMISNHNGNMEIILNMDTIILELIEQVKKQTKYLNLQYI